MTGDKKINYKYDPQLLVEAKEIKKKFDAYNQRQGTNHKWTMTKDIVTGYSNDFIDVIRIDSSNKWLGKPHKSLMSKMWSIIIEIKIDFQNLDTYRLLSLVDFCIDVTPVARGKNKGKQGIRIYNMKQEPNETLIKELLDFIFKKAIFDKEHIIF